jgi:hypothetical protein
VECKSCKSDNPESNKFCGQCGKVLTTDPAMQAAVREEIDSRLKDRNVVEVEVAEKVQERLITRVEFWSKMVGLNIAIFLATLTLVGIRSFDAMLGRAQKAAETKMAASITGAQTKMSENEKAAEAKMATSADEVSAMLGQAQKAAETKMAASITTAQTKMAESTKAAESKMATSVDKVSKDFEKTAREQSGKELEKAVTEARQGFQDEIGRARAQVASASAELESQLKMSQLQFSKTIQDVQTQVNYLALRSQCEDVKDFHQCHSKYPTGCSPTGGYDAYLNFLKNSLAPPSDPIKYLTLDDFGKLDAETPLAIERGNQVAFKDQLEAMGEGKLHGVVGFLYYVLPAAAESANCELTGPTDDPEKSNVDYHVGIGFDSTVAQNLRTTENAETRGPGAARLRQTSVVVEMTPEYRFQFARNIWTLENLKKVVGHRVRVVGQLMLDSEHTTPSQNCAATTPKQTCWRASAWELHPVVRFQVCPNDSCEANSPEWVELDKLQ